MKELERAAREEQSGGAGQGGAGREEGGTHTNNHNTSIHSGNNIDSFNKCFNEMLQ